MRTAAFVFCATALLSACASDDSAQPAESASERLYVTGSNIPKKANAPADANIPMGMGVRVQSREDLERMQGSGNGAPRKGDGL